MSTSRPNATISVRVDGNSTTDPQSGQPKASRVRRWAPKTRTGCTICRSRHLKCDEAKPSCKRCTSTHRICGGYDSIVRSPVSHLSRRFLSPFQARPTVQEAQVFQLFCTETVGRLGCSSAANRILQSLNVYPAMWHAGLALASMHKRLQLMDYDNEHNASVINHLYQFSVTQYNASITHIINAVQQDSQTYSSQETLLTTSIFYSIISIFSGDRNDAIVHAKNSITLFHQWKFWLYDSDAQKKGVFSVHAITSLITTFEFQLVAGLPCARTSPLRQIFDGMLLRAYKPSFQSLSDACVNFQPLLRCLLKDQYNQDQRAPHSACLALPEKDWRSFYRDRFAVWRPKFHELLQANKHGDILFTGNDIINAFLLGSYAVFLEIFLQANLWDPHMCWDQHKDSFAHSVKLAEQAYGWKRKLEPYAFESCLSLYASLCEPLFYVGRACRDGRIRRRVISLLRKYPRKEAIWSTKIIADILESTMTLEESGIVAKQETWGCECGRGFICRLHRVGQDGFEFLHDGSARLMLKTVDDVQKGRPWKIFHIVY